MLICCWRVLTRSEDGLVAVIDESATDQAARGGYPYDAQWNTSDQCGCSVGTTATRVWWGCFSCWL